MRIYTTLQIGELHTNHCEDYLITTEIGKNRLLCAVMDGCTMGTDSCFAAILTGKLLRKISKEYSYKEFYSKESTGLQETLQNINRQLFQELRSAKNILQLERDEVLNTLLMGVIDISNRAGEFICIGDGLVCIDQQLYEYEQDNKPDYLGYHLHEEFDSWYAKQQQRISAQDIHDFSLATDGIFTFKKFDNKTYAGPGNVIEFLLVDVEESNHSNMLNRKLLDIQTNWGLKPGDDLAIIRIRFN
ncbi:protein phosphatase 2C domain-containing protein [Longitalea luteola]|uniref:protein phosphatase 2C domain-containing protein n=1 Tax=Longitalea luteola TaxID=2812563 RepID=UPI001F6054C2|nr:protein phosphatase 2C domain-containing protein [Longitalea luteola]